MGSSPHTRGAPPGRLDVHVRERIIPAYAGSTVGRPELQVSRQDHPRIRGEHSSKDATLYRKEGSSPHTRGALFDDGVCRVVSGIIPAYAGSTRAEPPMKTTSADHPRIRGEHVFTDASPPQTRGSSPHTRGARGGVLVDFAVLGIIPAYAGSTLSRILPALPNADHPRIRGEHFDLAEGLPVADGSSPHTRGAHRRGRPPSQNHRIIPAYAGSTPTASCPG